MKSRKLLVPIDLENPNRKIKGYLYPNIDNIESNEFIEINSKKTWRVGMVILKGGGVDENDIFKEIVDSGKKIPSVDYLLSALKKYLIQINEFKIGNVVGVELFKNDFNLVKLKKPIINKNERTL